MAEKRQPGRLAVNPVTGRGSKRGDIESPVAPDSGDLPPSPKRVRGRTAIRPANLMGMSNALRPTKGRSLRPSSSRKGYRS